MKQILSVRLPLLLGLSLLLLACGARQVAPEDDAEAASAYRERQQRISALDSWTLSGKLSVDDGQDGGSGRLSWRVDGANARLEFRGALGRGAWRLDISPHMATLEKADGSVLQAATAGEIAEHEAGWHIPVEALQSWVLGVAAPGPVDALEFDPEGRALLMHQHGWVIRFSRYRSFGELELPGRVDVVRGERRVKLAIVDWNPLPQGGADA